MFFSRCYASWMRRGLSFLLLAAVGVACASRAGEAEPEDDGAEDGTHRPVVDDLRPKGEPDAGGVEDDDVPPGPFAMAPGLANSALPAKLEDVTDLEPPGFIDLASTAIVNGGLLQVFYERFDEAFSSGRIMVTTSTDGRTFAPPAPWAEGGHTFEASPSFATNAAGERAFYFARSNRLGDAPTLVRAVLPSKKRSPRDPRVLPAVAGIDTLLSWPKFETLADGRVALAFRDGASRPMAAFSEDGKSFGVPELVGPEGGGAMAAIGSFGPPTGPSTVAFTYQTQAGDGQAEPMISWFRIKSGPSAAWTTPAKVTTASANVHDTTIVTRKDGNVDLYYIYPEGKGFSLFRRALGHTGSLGVEQRLTSSEITEPSKPSITRLGDQGLHVRFARITVRAASGEPTEQRLSSILLADDAPAPP